jgi:predicted ester cyclase
MIAEGDTVATRMTWSGTQQVHLGAFDAPSTGRRMEQDNWAFARVVCGKIAEVWVLPDNLTMLRELGIITDEELRDAGTPTVATPTP